MSVADLIAYHNTAHATFAATARDIRDSGRMDEQFTDAFGFPQSLGTPVIHVLLHNQDHRYEARHILRRLGVELEFEGDPTEWEWLTKNRPELFEV